MPQLHYFFAGGGTGGHIYPAIAVAEQIRNAQPDAKITFFCSQRKIDSRILAKTDFEYLTLPGRAFSARPDKFIAFCIYFWKSYILARKKIAASRPAVLLGIGGFVSAPVVVAAHRLKVPISLLNLDIVPGRANKVLAKYSKEIFVQFEDTKGRLPPGKTVTLTGCPLRAKFQKPESIRVRRLLDLGKSKKILLIMGGSSGAASINAVVCLVLDRLARRGGLAQFVDDWQIVHLAGPYAEWVRQEYKKTKFNYKVLDYFDDMPDLLAIADLVVGRAGAVSVAEYAAASVPSICLPYPYHKDRHQYLNADKLVQAGCAVIVEDLADQNETAERLTAELVDLMGNEARRSQMSQACRRIARLDGAAEIAKRMSDKRP
jgi:UDP-N-acetylglucosamine--N-acetylmuramyl-(pentapeptide) pyrophosphoryl-undecaprenol N-acetylglucosamine transferase